MIYIFAGDYNNMEGQTRKKSVPNVGITMLFVKAPVMGLRIGSARVADATLAVGGR